MQYVKAISSRILLQEFLYPKKQFCGTPPWVSGYLTVSSGSITDEVIKKYIDNREREP